MPRPIRTKEEKSKYGQIWNACDTAYHWAYDNLPSLIKDRISERTIAFSLGALSGYGTAEFGAKVAYPLMNSTAESFGANLPSLEAIASHALVGTVSIPVELRFWLQKNIKNGKKYIQDILQVSLELWPVQA